MEYIEFSGKTVDDAITEACQKLTVTSDKLDYEIIDKGSSGFLGIGTKNAVIKARVKSEDDIKNETVSESKLSADVNKVVDNQVSEVKKKMWNYPMIPRNSLIRYLKQWVWKSTLRLSRSEVM